MVKLGVSGYGVKPH